MNENDKVVSSPGHGEVEGAEGAETDVQVVCKVGCVGAGNNDRYMYRKGMRLQPCEVRG